jgi:hypothetical protein
MDYGLDPVGTKDQDTARDLPENHYSRAQILVPKGAKVNKPPEKNPAERLLKAVFGNKTSVYPLPISTSKIDRRTIGFPADGYCRYWILASAQAPRLSFFILARVA